jgi:hypothetical protein
LALALTAFGPAVAQPGSPPGHAAPALEKFDKVIVFMGAGDFDLSTPTADPLEYHLGIMGRTFEEFQALEAEAIAFFKQRFGLDPNDPAMQGRIFLFPFHFEPTFDLRARFMSEAAIPGSGFVVRDGGWQLAVIDPAGVTLGGEFAGVHVPPGGTVTFGHYNIKMESVSGRGPGGPEPDPIIIHYRSLSPIVPDARGDGHFRCELISEEFGPGIAQGVFSRAIPIGNGVVRINIRNILTFPPFGHIDP